MIPIVTFDRRAPRAYRSCTSRVTSTTPRPDASPRPWTGPGVSRAEVLSPVLLGFGRSRDRDRKARTLASESLDRAYREQYPADEQTESWLEDDMRDPSASRQDSTLDRRDSIEEIWNALQACPSAQAARSYSRGATFRMSTSPRLEDEASITRKTLPRPSRWTSSPRVPTRAHVLIIFSRTALLVALLYA